MCFIFKGFVVEEIHLENLFNYWLIDWLVFNTNLNSISAISLHEQILSCHDVAKVLLKLALNTNQSI